MFLAFILLIIVAFCGAQFAPPGRLHTDYCFKATTTAVNGIFVVMVFFRHLNTYLQVSAADPLQKQWATVNGFLGQLIVVSFLFYSGYGIFCSIEKKGTPYVRRMFPHHFLRLFVHFDVCVLLFALVNVLLHRQMSGKDLLLALTTYTSIGNSNWYITAVLLLYICTMAAFLCFRRHPLPALVLVTVLCIGCVFGQIKLHRPDYCYNTMVVFPLGMWYRYLQPKIDALLQRSGLVYSLAVCGTLLVFGFSGKYLKRGVEFYSLWACAFAGLLVLLTMKIKPGNSVLTFLGSHVFSIYILQRIPMMVLSRLGFAAKPLQFLALSFACTVVIALLFDQITGKLDPYLFDWSRKKTNVLTKNE